MPAVAAAEDPPAGPPDPKTLRNLEQEGELVADPGRTLVNAILLLPRDIVNGVLASTAYGTEPTDDPKLIERSDLVFPLPKKVGFFPRFDLSSESGIAAGANLYYRGRETGVILTGVFRNQSFWNAGGIVGWQRPHGRSVFKLSLLARFASDDAHRFFGLGSDPAHDPRAPVRPEASDDLSFGRYVDRYDSASLVAGVRTRLGVELYYETNYRRRTIQDLRGQRRVARLLLRSRGAAWPRHRQAVVQRALGPFRYAAISRARRSRLDRGRVLLACRRASGGDERRFGRAGGELLAHLPVFRRNRLLVPKISVDHLWNRRPDLDVSFADYPRHYPFRGVGARRTILRTDNWVLVPSLEYQWPLTYRTHAQIFCDVLVVGRSLGEIRASGSPWAAGLALEMHSQFRSLARLLVAGGSEGIRFGIELSPPVKTNDRTRWH